MSPRSLVVLATLAGTLAVGTWACSTEERRDQNDNTDLGIGAQPPEGGAPAMDADASDASRTADAGADGGAEGGPDGGGAGADTSAASGG